MSQDRPAILKRRIRILLLFFITALVLSGATALPLQWETTVLAHLLAEPHWHTHGPLAQWLITIQQGVQETYTRYPFMAYGTDWLAFGHFAIALAFLGPLRDPVRNAWVLDFGIMACLLVIPYALAAGAFRGIPPGWRLIDCSFGVFGVIPLWYCRRYVKELAGL